jgi:mRNA interferase MazF
MTSDDRPQRGEIWLTAFGASKSGEPGKTRPAVVLSPAGLTADSPRGLVVVVPLSSSVDPSALRPVVSDGGGIDTNSRAVPMAIRGMARARLLKRIGSVSAGELAAIGSAVSVSLGLSEA